MFPFFTKFIKIGDKTYIQEEILEVLRQKERSKETNRSVLPD